MFITIVFACIKASIIIFYCHSCKSNQFQIYNISLNIVWILLDVTLNLKHYKTLTIFNKLVALAEVYS